MSDRSAVDALAPLELVGQEMIGGRTVNLYPNPDHDGHGPLRANVDPLDGRTPAEAQAEVTRLLHAAEALEFLIHRASRSGLENRIERLVLEHIRAEVEWDGWTLQEALATGGLATPGTPGRRPLPLFGRCIWHA